MMWRRHDAFATPVGAAWTPSWGAPPGAGGIPARERSASSASDLGGLVASALLVAYLLYVFVGLTPFYSGERADRAGGGSLDRIVLIAFAGTGVLVLALRLRSTIVALARTWPIWLMVALICASVVWSAFPDLTVRRALATALIAFTCFSLAVGAHSLERLHAILFLVLGLVVLASFAALAARPDFAITPIGVRGYLPQKNVLGLVMLVACLVAVCRFCGLGPGRPLARLVSLGVAGASLAMLALTQSKTSIAITALLLVAIPCLVLLRRLGPGIAGLVAIGGAGLAGATALLFAGLPLDMLIRLLVPDLDLTFTGRDEIWDLVAADIASRPLTGFGYGAYWDVPPDADPITRAPPGSWLGQTDAGLINSAHNGYLDLWVQVGLPGLLLAVGLVAWCAWRSLRLFMRADAARGERWAALLILLLFVGLSIHNFSESTLWFRGQTFANLSILMMFLMLASRSSDRPAGVR